MRRASSWVGGSRSRREAARSHVSPLVPHRRQQADSRHKRYHGRGQRRPDVTRICASLEVRRLSSSCCRRVSAPGLSELRLKARCWDGRGSTPSWRGKSRPPLTPPVALRACVRLRLDLACPQTRCNVSAALST